MGRGGARPGAGRPVGIEELAPRRRSSPAQRESIADFFADVELFTNREVLPEMKELFLSTQDKRLKADLGKWFASYAHGSPVQRVATSPEQKTSESILMELFRALPREVSDGPGETPPQPPLSIDEA